MTGRPRRSAAAGVLLCAAAALAVLLSTSSALAQTTSGALHGTVRDPGGNPVDAAVVQARHAQTGAVRTTVTDALGRYRLTGIEPGSWSVVARGPDGTASASVQVEIGLQKVVLADLEIGGGMTETVEVVATAPIIDPRQVGGELRIDGEQTDGLPVADRDALRLALLDSSVRTATPGVFFGERGAPFVLNGQSGRSNAYLVDGLDNNDQTSGTTANAFFSQQVVREFVVMTSQYAPEFGRATGGIVNVVTRQGTNDHTGEAFVQGAPSGWASSGDLVDALPDTGGPSTPERFVGGFRVGGPIRRDRAFYFLAYEHSDADEIVPYTGVDRDLSPGGRAVAETRGDNLFFRADFNLSDRQFLMVRASADDRRTPMVNVGGRATPESGFRIEERDYQAAATWKWVVSDRILNEVRFLAATSSFEQFANSERPGVSRPSGIFGGNNLAFQDRDETRFQIVENLTMTRGDHAAKFGFDVTRSETTLDTRFNPLGNLLYTTDDPFDVGDCLEVNADQVDRNDPRAPIPCTGDGNGNGIPDEPAFIYTYPQVYQFIFGEPSIRIPDTRVGLFAQDSWRPNASWQVDYGLRYDVSTYRLPDSAVVDSSIVPNGGASRDTDDVAPRLGFTWNPGGRGKTVVRGGAGLFYDKLVLAFPAVAAVTSGTRIGLTVPQGFAFEITEDIVERFVAENGYDAFREIVESEFFFPEELVLRFSTATELDTPYTVQYSLGFERALGARSAVRARAVRSLGYRLPQMRDLNPVVSINPPCEDAAGDPVPGDLSCVGIPVHLDSSLGSIAAITTEGRSWYSGLDLGYRWQGSASWLSLSYTLSKSEDTGPDPLKGGIYLPPDPDDLDSERGRSDHDRRHRAVLAVEGPLRVWGLRGSVVAQYMSGAPFNVTTGLDENRDGIDTDRPDGVRRNSGEDTPIDVVNAIRVDEGLAPFTGTLEEPDFLQVDLRLSKRFVASEGSWSGEVYAQVFNLFDRYNVGLVEGRITSRGFGLPIAYAGPPRTVEVGLRIGF